LTDQQNERYGSYQQGKQNTGDERNNPMPTIHALVPSSAFLCRSDTQPNEKFVHTVSAVIDVALWRPYYAYDYGEFPYSASAKSPNPGQGYLAQRRLER
jgi:hypothetical protein